MFKHILKMIWNRKRANSLIIVEVAIAFIVVFVLAVITIRSYSLYQIPLGFEYENMWQVRFSTEEWQAERDQATLQQLVTTLRQQREVEHVHLMAKPTFENSSWGAVIDIEDKTIEYYVNKIDDGAAEDMGMKLIAGRWFGREDTGQNYEAVVVNKRFVEEAYANKDPLGRNIADLERGVDKNSVKEQRIVGVFEEFRQLGELSSLVPYVFVRYDLERASSDGGGISLIQIKVNQNTSIAYEEKLMKILNGIAPSWNFSIEQWDSLRESQLKLSTFPLVVFSIVAIFLIAMVAMGLFGVLWQNVTQRTREIGLRRAMGATAVKIHWQIISELLLVAMLGIAISFLILIQFPLAGVFSDLNWSLFWLSMLVAVVFMLVLAMLCAYYPGKVATNYVPADALHYD